MKGWKLDAGVVSGLKEHAHFHLKFPIYIHTWPGLHKTIDTYMVAKVQKVKTKGACRASDGGPSEPADGP